MTYIPAVLAGIAFFGVMPLKSRVPYAVKRDSMPKLRVRHGRDTDVTRERSSIQRTKVRRGEWQ